MASIWLDLGVGSNILNVEDLRKFILGYLALMDDFDFQGQTNFFKTILFSRSVIIATLFILDFLSSSTSNMLNPILKSS